MHVAGTRNTAADFLSRIDLNPKERVELKIRNDITIRPKRVNLLTTDVADEEQHFLISEETIETEEKILLQKKTSKTKCARRIHDKNKIDYQRNKPNSNEQGIIYLCGNKRRRTY